MAPEIRLLQPAAVLRFPRAARPNDWVSCVGFDSERALFMSTPNAELAGAVPADLTTVSRATGGVLTTHRFTLHAMENGRHDWFAAISLAARRAITRCGELVSIDDGEVCRVLPPDGEGRSFWSFADDGGRFLWARTEAGKWIYSVLLSSTGEEQGRASGAAPMMVYVDGALSSVVVVGGGRAYTARTWQTTDQKMKVAKIAAKGEPIFAPGLARWIVWQNDDLVVGRTAGGETNRFPLPTKPSDASVRYRLGDELLVLTVVTAEALDVVVVALSTGDVVAELRRLPPPPQSAPPYLDPSGRWVIFVAKDGTYTWRIGTRDVWRAVPPERGGPFAIAGLNMVSSVAGPAGAPWTEGGLSLVGQEAVAFYRAPE